jgi:hypothetical protein
MFIFVSAGQDPLDIDIEQSVAAGRDKSAGFFDLNRCS